MAGPPPDRVQAFVARVEAGDTLGALRDFYAGPASQQENDDPPRQGLAKLLEHEAQARARVQAMQLQCLARPVIEHDWVWMPWRLRWLPQGAPAEGWQDMAQWTLQRWQDGRIVQEQFRWRAFRPGDPPPAVRQAMAADVPAIQRIRHAVTENRLTSRRIADAEVIEHLERHGRGWVAEWRGAVAGFAIGDARDGNIWALFVDPPCAGRGIGRQLHDEMVAWLWRQGLDRLHLCTEPGTRAEGFYRAAGWQALGVKGGEMQFECRRPSEPGP